MGYSQKFIKGFGWAGVLNALATATSFVKIVILSKLIFGPTEFGIFGVGVLILGILELITETGINIFLIQEEDDIKTYLNTAWVISIVRGVLIASLMAILSYPISIFFKIPSHWNFIVAFSVLPLVRGFINPAITGLQKNLEFKKDAFYRFSISFIEDISILGLAILTHNIFSFVIGILFGNFIEVGLTFILVKEKPSLKFEKLHFKKIINRGKWVTLAQVFDYLYRHTDDITVGRLLNVASLGIYQNSYTFASLPENLVSQQISKIALPVYVNIKEDPKRIKRAFWRTFFATFGIILPFAIIMFFASDPLVRIFLNEKWLPAIPILKILAIFGLSRSLTNLFYPVFLAYKKQSFVMTTTLVSWVILGITIIPLILKFGLNGAALSALIGSISGLPVAFYLFNKLLNANSNYSN